MKKVAVDDWDAERRRIDRRLDREARIRRNDLKNVEERDLFGAPISRGDWADLKELMSSYDPDEERKIKEILNRPKYGSTYHAFVREYPAAAAVRAGFPKTLAKTLESENFDGKKRTRRLKKVIAVALVNSMNLGEPRFDRNKFKRAYRRAMAARDDAKNDAFRRSLENNLSQVIYEDKSMDPFYSGDSDSLVSLALPDGSFGGLDFRYAKDTDYTSWMKPSKYYYEKQGEVLSSGGKHGIISKTGDHNMTQAFIDGFMSKCAEAGLDEKQADTLLRKQADIANRLGSAAFNAFPGLGFLRKSYQSYLDKRKPGRVNGVLQGGEVPPGIPQQLRNPMPKSAELKKQAGLGGLARGLVRAARARPVRTIGALAGGLGLTAAAVNKTFPAFPKPPSSALAPVENNLYKFPALRNLDAYYNASPNEADAFLRSFDDKSLSDLKATALAPNDYVYNPVGDGYWDFSPAVTNAAGRVIGAMPKQFRTPQMTNDVLNAFHTFRNYADRDPAYGPTGSMHKYRKNEGDYISL